MSEQLDTQLEPTTSAPETPGSDLMDDFVTSLTAPETTPTPEEKPAEEQTPTEEKPAAEETAETSKTDEEAIPEAPKNRKDWDTLRASRDRHKQTAEEVQNLLQTKEKTLETLAAELEELKAKASRLPELEDKLKDFDTYEKELAVTRLEATREYKETILKPLQVIGETAVTLAKSNEADADKVYDMLREADPVEQRKAFKELTTGWDDVDRSELWAMTKDARTILDKQDAMRENASAAAKEQAQRAAEREQQERAEFRKEFTTKSKEVVKVLREQVPFIPLAEGETEEDRYTSLAAKLAEVDFDSQAPRGKAFAAATAVMYPQMVKTIQELQKEVATLKARVSDDNSAKPSGQKNEQSRPAATDEDFLAAMGVPASPMLSQSLNVVGV